jgi:predicted nucleic acid-binding Zn ribbon protein
MCDLNQSVNVNRTKEIIADFRVSDRKETVMPLYQFWCDECFTPYEIQMKLAKLDEYDKGDKIIECPGCGTPLRKLMCPPKTITIN